MESLLTADNIAIVVLAAWIIEAKRNAAAQEKRIERQWQILMRLQKPLTQIRDLLRARFARMDETGEFYGPLDDR